jgi:hypothetical protein
MRHYLTDLVSNPNTFNNLKKCLTKPLAIVCIVQTSEAKKGAFDLPNTEGLFLNPMTSYCEVAISVGGLPCVTCEIDMAFDSLTLNIW